MPGGEEQTAANYDGAIRSTCSVLWGLFATVSGYRPTCSFNYFDLNKREFSGRDRESFWRRDQPGDAPHPNRRLEMQERQVSIDGVTTALATPFFVIATLNPIEMEGTFPLPEAQLDRFLLRLDLGYPTVAEEAAMLERFAGVADGLVAAPVAGPEEIARAQMEVDGVVVDAAVRCCLLAIVGATRDDDRLRHGASPRAALALQRASQAYAAVQGRRYVIPDDIKALAVPALAHRLVVLSEARLRGVSAASVVDELLDRIAVPIEG